MLADHFNKAIVVSLHGMKEDKDGVSTSLIISDGARAEDPGRTHPATKLRVAMEDAEAPGKVVSCNLVDDKQHKAPRLCGLTNIQGRYVNGDADECRDNVDQVLADLSIWSRTRLCGNLTRRTRPISRMTSSPRDLSRRSRAPFRPILELAKGHKRSKPNSLKIPGEKEIPNDAEGEGFASLGADSLQHKQ